jgi:thiamine pyrophosphate-dependent acetolactate synthase large subunit-like protein
VKVFEAVANALSNEDVSEVFGLMGDGNMKLLAYWTSEMEMSYHGTRHESAAIAMADGYFRATGRVGVCTVTQGPGVTNALTARAQSWLANPAALGRRCQSAEGLAAGHRSRVGLRGSRCPGHSTE